MASWNKVELPEVFEITLTDEPSETERAWKLFTYSRYTCAATIAQVLIFDEVQGKNNTLLPTHER